MALSIPIAGGLGALALAVGARLVWRSLHESTVRPDGATPALVLGVGSAGTQLVANMLADPDSPYMPVGLLDDDPAKRHLRIQGIPVLGNRTALKPAMEQTGAEVLIIAIPSARSELFRDVSESARGAGAEGQGAAQPAPDPQRQGGPARPARHRHHRPPRPRPGGHRRGGLAPATSRASGCWSPARAARSARSCAGSWCSFDPAKLLMLDRDESALHTLQLSIDGHGAARHRERDPGRHPRPRGAARGLRQSTARRWCSTPRRSSTCRCSSSTRRRRGRPTCWARPTCWRPRATRAWRCSSTSPPTRPPTRPACWATPSGSPSG